METLELPKVMVEPWCRSTRISDLVYVPQEAIAEVGLHATCHECELDDDNKYDHEECSNHNCGRGVWMEFEDAISVKLGSKP